MIESAIVDKPIDGTVIDVGFVRGAMFTCFFGSTFAYVFFVVLALRAMGETLAVFRSTARLPMPFGLAVVVAVVVVVDDGNVMLLLLQLLLLVLVDVVLVPFDNGIADNSSLLVAAPDGRTTIFARSFRRLGNAFIWVLKNPVIFVCERMFGALPLLMLLLIPEVTVAEDFDPFGILLVRFESVRLFASVSHSAIELFAVELLLERLRLFTV